MRGLGCQVSGVGYSFCLLAFLMLGICGCVENDNLLPLPARDPVKSRLTHSTPIALPELRMLEGVYQVVSGKVLFGDEVVVKQIGSHIGVFCAKETSFVFETGFVDSEAILEGYWRSDLGTQQGFSTLAITKDFALNPHNSFTLTGHYTSNQAGDANPFELHFLRALKDTTNNFLIVDHHGGDNGAGLPFAENSLNAIRYTQYAGANAIELDVRLTGDNIPILFHDADLSTNLVNGEFAIGPLTNYTLAELRQLCTLKDGSQIPTLQDALNVIDSETSYQAVWLDIKDSAGVAPTLPIEIAFLDRMKSEGRTVAVWAGLPTTDHVTAYLNDPLHTLAPSLCELTPADVDHANSEVWGPRWTVGDLVKQAKTVRQEGKKVIYWTVDKPEFINPFLDHGELDGLLTDHPSTVGYYYYIRK